MERTKGVGTLFPRQLLWCAEQLANTGARFVLAESCTGGMAAAAVTQVPGISQSFCGSLVAYREVSKTAWIGVPEALIAAETAVSQRVAEAMARGALERAIEAQWSAAVTGHLGPDAPPTLDGLIFTAVANRLDGSVRVVASRGVRLASHSRGDRQLEAATVLLSDLWAAISACRTFPTGGTASGG
jgi:nicotinamide-nucleotide amidase